MAGLSEIRLMRASRGAGGRAVTVGRASAPPGLEARRALVLHDRALVIDLITLTLNHGVFAVRAASSLAEAEAILPSGARSSRWSTWTTPTARR